MNCPECVIIQQGAERVRYRWRDTVLILQGCQEHVAQVLAVLNVYQEEHFQ